MCYRDSDTVTAYKPDRTVASAGRTTAPRERVRPPAARSGPRCREGTGCRAGPAERHRGVVGQSTRSRLLRVFCQVNHISLSLNVILWRKEHDPLCEKAFRAVYRKGDTCAPHTTDGPSDGTRAECRPSHSRAGERGEGGLQGELSSPSGGWGVRGGKGPRAELKYVRCRRTEGSPSSVKAPGRPQSPSAAFLSASPTPPSTGPTGLPSGTATHTAIGHRHSGRRWSERSRTGCGALPVDRGGRGSMHPGELKVPEVAPRDSQFGKKRENLKCVKTIPKVLLRNTITIY